MGIVKSVSHSFTVALIRKSSRSRVHEHGTSINDKFEVLMYFCCVWQLSDMEPGIFEIRNWFDDRCIISRGKPLLIYVRNVDCALEKPETNREKN